MTIMNSNININDLKKICKINYVDNFTKINKNNKNEYVQKLSKSINVIKIQRWFRKLYIGKNKCPISFDTIKYPCYAFKTKNGILTYYQLYTLKQYLIDTGNFSDPLTRINFEERQLNDIDIIDKYYRTFKKNNTQYLSLLSYSKNSKHYEKKKKYQDEILLKERILDLLCQDIIRLLVNQTNVYNIYNSIETIYLNNYRKNIMSLNSKDKDHANYILNKNINNVICSIEDIDDSKKTLYQYVLDFMSNIKYEISSKTD